jgi:hypothetical protein
MSDWNVKHYKFTRDGKKSGGKIGENIQKKFKELGGNIFETMSTTTKNIKNEGLSNFIDKHILLFAAIILIIYIFLIHLAFKKNPWDIKKKFPIESIMGSLVGGYILIMIFYFINWNNKHQVKATKKEGKHTDSIIPYLFLILASILGYGSAILFFIVIFKILEFNKNATSILILSSNIFILIGLLSLIFKFLEKTQIKYPNWMNVIFQVIFFIPCLLVAFVDNLKKEWKITQPSTWILLVIEIVFILLRFLIPFILNLIVTHDGKHLLKEKVYLNAQHTIGNYKDLHKSKKDRYSYHYAISSWIYINPQPESTSLAYAKNTSLLNYGGKPNIMYNGTTKTLTIKAQKSRNETIQLYKTKNFPYQRWNHLVINYDRGTLDVFINDELVASEKNVVPYMTYDLLTVGSDSGINGGVTNVVYYDKVLTRNKIHDLYNVGNLQ